MPPPESDTSSDAGSASHGAAAAASAAANKDLRSAFEAFASFGSSRNLAASAPIPNAAATTIDSARFAKLARDTGLIAPPSLTIVDVDLIFEKCKIAKGTRKLDFKGFKKALQMVAEKRQCDYSHVVAIVVAGSPALTGTIPDYDPVIEKLTDTSLYTGTHKNRFDPETGVGRGLEGREPVNTTSNLANLVSRHNPNKTLGAPTPPKSPAMSRTASTPNRSGSEGSLGSAPSSPSARPSVFDRLTSVSTFTGSHKHRFNADGTGRGKEGRVGDGAGDVVSDLSQITRR
ncbi:p25-alpha-domain-containing protein [Zopfochytrium polystomum]|nr:p25-alpha-domain-containing protein [Zopfochytrium polystomum]